MPLIVLLTSCRRSHAAQPRARRWDDSTIGGLLSSVFFGYLWTQIPGGVLATHYGAKRVLLVGVCGWSLLTILTPLCASRVWLFVLVRVCLGAFEGVGFPSIHALLAVWTPPHEASPASNDELMSGEGC